MRSQKALLLVSHAVSLEMNPFSNVQIHEIMTTPENRAKLITAPSYGESDSILRKSVKFAIQNVYVNPSSTKPFGTHTFHQKPLSPLT